MQLLQQYYLKSILKILFKYLLYSLLIIISFYIYCGRKKYRGVRTFNELPANTNKEVYYLAADPKLLKIDTASEKGENESIESLY